MGAMAPSAGGRRHATWSELNPDHEVPYMPTRPFDHSCSASQAITWQMSSCSSAVYSSVARPLDEPVPRMSRRQMTKPPSSQSRSYSEA